MKFTKKIISIMLALLMIASAIVVASAKSKETYLILGDSIGYGAGVINSNEAVFGKLVADTCKFNYKNDAISGSMTDDLIKLLDVPSVKNDIKNATIISISIGGNDYLRADMQQLIKDGKDGNMELFDEIAKGTKKNFATIIKTVKKLNPDALVLCQTLYNPGTGTLKTVYQFAVDRLNKIYRNYLKNHEGAYELLEVGKAFKDHPEYIAPDNIHPNADGNVAIAKVVLKKLNSLGITDKTKVVVTYEGINQDEIFSIKTIKYIVRSITKIFKK